MTYNEQRVNYHIARARRIQHQAEERMRAVARGCITVVGIIILAVLLTALCKPRPYTEDTVIVSSAAGRGTLWDIAAEHCPDDMDIRKYISYIKADNDCTATIHNGDVLTIRVYEEK